MRTISFLQKLALFTPLAFTLAASAEFSITKLQNGEMALAMPATVGTFHRIEASDDLAQWTLMMTLQSDGALTHTDTAAPYHSKRFYRSAELIGTGHLTGDHIQTSTGELIIHPVDHASFVMSWNGKMIYVDPVGGPTLYAAFPKADLILVTHNHNDHYHVDTLASVLSTGGKIVCPNSVHSAGAFAGLVSSAILMKTGQTPSANNTPPQTVHEITIEGVPAYNTSGTIYHPLGAGNAYVLNIGGKRIFISGDTGDTSEMRALPNIDVAFVCMNSPFTMTETTAAGVVRAFKPKIVFPYHFKNSDGSYADLVSFKQQVGTNLGMEVRVRTWYPPPSLNPTSLKTTSKCACEE
jgi:L-ascorbate metabolism protein UlaG (beta-lactamase superfamily)